MATRAMRDEACAKVVRCAYDLSGSENDWLQRLASAVAHILGGRDGAMACQLQRRAAVWGIRDIAFPNDCDDRATVEASLRALPFDVFRAVLRGRRPTVLLHEVMTRAIPRRVLVLQACCDELGLQDALLVRAYVETNAAVVLAVGFDHRVRASTHERKRWNMLAGHITAAHRLRHALEEHSSQAGGRAHLRAQAIASQHEVPGVDGDRDRILRLWRGLLAGRLSLVDQFDAHGRRYLVARRNQKALRDPRALTRRQQQVAAFVALGLSNKLIAYTLGLAPSTVAAHQRQAQHKLGFASRVEMVRCFGRGARLELGPQPPTQRTEDAEAMAPSMSDDAWP